MDGSLTDTAAAVETTAAPAPTQRRPVKPVNVRGLDIAPPSGGGRPDFIWVRPETLLVDDAYQRRLSEKSINLIRRIAAAWDWRRFKPPIVARTDAGLEVIDGQHTAIAAASHPAIAEIPVMVVEAESREDRAGAFIGHNKDRLQVTPTQMHHSAVAAGDPHAIAIDRVCKAAGVNLLANSPGAGAFKARDTMAVGAIGALIRRRGEEHAQTVLSILAAADLAPIGMGQIKAVDMLLSEPEYAGSITGSAITELLRYAAAAVDQEAQLFAAAHGVPQWKALGVVMFRKARRGRRGAH